MINKSSAKIDNKAYVSCSHVSICLIIDFDRANARQREKTEFFRVGAADEISLII